MAAKEVHDVSKNLFTLSVSVLQNGEEGFERMWRDTTTAALIHISIWLETLRVALEMLSWKVMDTHAS